MSGKEGPSTNAWSDPRPARAKARLRHDLRFLAMAVALIAASRAHAVAQSLVGDWRDGGVCYEVFVRSFQDGNGDGIGDLEGLIRRLDYINDGNPDTRNDLGASCIWLMPFYPSPSYHGYDVTDSYRVNPVYGTNADFERLIAEAHRRGIRVILDMVINHVSSEHPWFKYALMDRESPWRDWFRWSNEPGPPNEWGGDNWRRTPAGDEYYYGFFWHTMPDLNWETPAVRQEMQRVAAFWLDRMGADGLRLDAVRHLMEEPGRSANVPRTHDMLREYAAAIRRIDPDAFTIGEVFDSTAAMPPYYPDQLDAYFAFEVADAILEAARSGRIGGLLDSVRRLLEIAPADRWGTFLRNHDQTRTLTWLGGDLSRARLAASLLFTLPGVPFVYYGEEIGMTGDKPDPRIRTPMQWSTGTAAGFTTGLPWEPLQPDSSITNVEIENADPASMLSLYRELIHLRGASTALGAGDFVALESGNDAVAAFLRRTDDEVVLVVSNLGATPVSGVRVSSDAPVLREGGYAASVLHGGRAASRLRIGLDGRIRDYEPVVTLAPRTTLVIGLSRRSGSREP